MKNTLIRHGIGSRLAASFAVLLALAVLLAAIGVRQLAVQSDRLRHLADVDNAMVDALVQVMRGVDQRAIAARNLVLVGRGDAQVAELARIRDAQQAIDAGLAAAAALPGAADGRERTLLQQLRTLEADYQPVAAEVVALAAAGEATRAIGVLTGRCMPLLSQVQSHLSAFQHQVQGDARRAAQEAQVDSARAAWLLALLTAAALPCGALLAWRITRSIVAPLREALDMAQAVARGDLARRCALHRRDETGQLLDALRRMADSLAGTVGQVRTQARSVALATAEIARGNGDLSERTEHQAGSLQRTASSMVQMQQTVRGNAEATVQATRLADEAADAARRGREAVQQVTATMAAIRDGSDRIAEIVAVIDGIAFQTNLLALNAAVEAARAGTQGRGFAVVAGEVRQLARRSSTAAREIKALIDASVARVHDGSACVDNAGGTLAEIVARVGQVGTLVSELSDANRLQHGGIDEIADAMQRLETVTQQNAALVEQSAAAADGLRQRAEALVHAVAVFQLPEDTRRDH